MARPPREQGRRSTQRRLTTERLFSWPCQQPQLTAGARQWRQPALPLRVLRWPGALSDAQDLTVQRAVELAERAVAEQATWITRRGPSPPGASARARWQHGSPPWRPHRERQDIKAPGPGPEPEPTDRDYWRTRDHAPRRRRRRLTRGRDLLMPRLPTRRGGVNTPVTMCGLEAGDCYVVHEDFSAANQAMRCPRCDQAITIATAEQSG